MAVDSDDQENAKDSRWFVFFVSSILALAIIMGGWIVRLNAELDQDREGRVAVVVGCLSRPMIVSNDPVTSTYARCKNRAGEVADDPDEAGGLVTDDPGVPKVNTWDD